MTFEQIITPDDGSEVAPHPHDASEISGEATLITLRVNRLLAGTIDGKEIIVAGGTDGILRSDNFATGTQGWQILGDGTAEFNDVTIRGDLVSDNFDGTQDLSSGPATDGTAGWFFDTSAGAGQISGDFFVGSSVQLFDTGAADPDDRWIIDRSSSEDLLFQFFDNSAASTTTRLLFGDGGGFVFSNEAGTERLRLNSSGETLIQTDHGTLEIYGSGGNVWLETADADDLVINNVNEIRTTAGTTSDPPYTFVGDDNTGMYAPGLDQIGFTTGGSRAFLVGTGRAVYGGGATGDAAIQYGAGSQSAPAYAFEGDLNTGIYRPGADTWGVTTGGSVIMAMDSEIRFYGNVAFQATTNRIRFNTAGGVGSSDANTDRVGLWAGNTDTPAAANEPRILVDSGDSTIYFRGATLDLDDGDLVVGSGHDITIGGSSVITASEHGSVSGSHVTNGDSHNHAGGDGAQISHTNLSSTGSGTGHVTNGDSHDHSGGDGGTISYSSISGTHPDSDHSSTYAFYGASTALSPNTNTDGVQTVRLSTSKAQHKENIRSWEISDEEWAQVSTHQFESKLDGLQTLKGFVWDYLPDSLRQEQTPDIYALLAACVSRIKRLEAA